MVTYKYIHWRDDIKKNDRGERFANIHLLVGYNQSSVADFCNMAKELRKSFPQATDNQILCGKVTKSSYVQAFSIVTLNMYLPEDDYPGWTQKSNSQVEYYW